MQIEPLLAGKNIHEYGRVDVKTITIVPGVRELCRQNACGYYGKNHMCPPAIKGIEEWKEEIFSFEHAFVVTKVFPTKNRFDVKAMHEGGVNFENTLRTIRDDADKRYPEKGVRILGAGPCLFCKECTCLTDEPCRFPDKAYPSVEACGVDVVRLSREMNLRYHNGKNTLTYFGMILCH